MPVFFFWWGGGGGGMQTKCIMGYWKRGKFGCGYMCKLNLTHPYFVKIYGDNFTRKIGFTISFIKLAYNI